MQRQDVPAQLAQGMQVFGSDGDKVGSIVAVDPAYIVVEKGFFFPTDYYIPLNAISRIDADGVVLTVTKDAALHQNWDVAPTATAAEVASTSTIPTTDWTGTAATAPVEPAPIRRGAADLAADQDTVVVPVAEEELTATKRPVQRGAVRVEKDVVAEERTLEVPITEEQVHVQRRAVDRPVTDADRVFEEGVIEVPVRGEEVELQKHARVAEEIALSKDAVQRTEQVRGTVRREEVRVADATDAAVVDQVAPDARGRRLAWNPTTHADYDLLSGKDVYSADGQKIGTIQTALHPRQDMPKARGRHYFLLDPTLVKDWFQGFDQVYLPESAIASVQPDRVVLNLTADQIKQRSQDWTRQPAGIDQYRWTDAGASPDVAGTTY